MQKYRESRYTIVQDEDFRVEKNADGTYDLISPAVGADGLGLRTDLSQTMSAIQVIKLGRQIEEIKQQMLDDLMRQREELEQTPVFLQASRNGHATTNGNGNGKAQQN